MSIQPEIRTVVVVKSSKIVDRLRDVLEEDIIRGKIVVSAQNRIHRRHYASTLGCSHSRMSQVSEIFDEFESRVSLVYVKPEPNLAKALRSLLEADAEVGNVSNSRGGKISRRHYAARLGCAPTQLTDFVSIFAEFEQKLGTSTGPMRHLPSMRVWLQESFDARELGVRDGKIDRAAFAKRFGLRGGTFMTRYPEIRALIREYDARAELEGYLPSAQLEELERLRIALAAGPELNNDRLTINGLALSEVATVPQGRFRDRYFAEAIAAAQDLITARAMVSKIDPFFHGRVFYFSDLVPAWGANFIERTAVRFKQVISGLSKNSSKQPYLNLINAFVWIGASNNRHCEAVVLEAKHRGRITDAGEWEDALFAYRDYLVAQIATDLATDSSVDAAVSSLRTALEALVSGGVVPQTASSLPGVKHARRRSGRLRSVAEAPAVGRDGTDYVTFAREHFEAARKTLEIDLGSGDSEPFFASIGQEVTCNAEMPDDPAVAVKIVLERRLDALRARAMAIVEDAESMFERGRELISKSNIDCEKFRNVYLGQSATNYKKMMLVRELFPSVGASDSQLELGTANLLAYIDKIFGGIAPRAGKADPEYGQFFQKRYLDYGGVGVISSMLVPDVDAVGATLTLYLIDSGANVSVGRTLSRDCCEMSDLEGYRRITGHKARAQGRPIIVDMPSDAPSVRAIDWLLSAGRRLPEYVEGFGKPGSDEDRLFLMRIGSRVQLMMPDWYTKWFKDFVSSIPALRALNLTPNMIRPSVLLHASLSNDGRLMTGMAWAQHTQGVAQGYQQKWPTRLRYDQIIRQFLESFESLVMQNLSDAADKLGITAEQFEVRLGNLQATGLGTFCRDGRGRPGTQGVSCSTVDCWNDCPHMMIVAEVEAIASLQIWQAALRQAQPEMERDQPERWDEVWLPWLCLTDVVEEKMVRGPMIKTWKAASKRASEISSEPGYVPAKPW